jgi:uncharacterized protein
MRKGDWIETYTGKKFWPLDPRPEDICIKDIAHALSCTCRYNGHCKHFFSVAQHSLNCSNFALREFNYRYALLALLHDAAEAYVSDIARPIKPFVKGFQEIEDGCQQVIYEALSVRPPNGIEQNIIKNIDSIMLVTEAKELMLFDGWGKWTQDINPDGWTLILNENPEEVKKRFLRQYNYLKREVEAWKA